MMIFFINMCSSHKQIRLPDTRAGAGSNMYPEVIILHSQRKGFVVNMSALTMLETNSVRVLTSLGHSYS